MIVSNRMPRVIYALIRTRSGDPLKDAGRRRKVFSKDERKSD